MILAITGATGFVGEHLVQQARAAGHRIRALTRRPQPDRDGVEWIAGSLGDAAALARLAEGADAIVHVAGAVNADRAGFIAANIEGTRATLAAAQAAHVRRFVHVSSLSAREPQLSTYGWSKREGEALVEASGLDWTIVRPSGVYGPRDTELLDVFRMAKWGVALLPPPGEVSLIAVEDLAILLLTLAEHGSGRTIYEVDDGRTMTHAELAQAIGVAVRRRVRPIHLPRPLLQLAAAVDTRLRGSGAKLTADRVGYLCHPDWTADAGRRPPTEVWTPRIELDRGLAQTAAWYRANGPAIAAPSSPHSRGKDRRMTDRKAIFDTVAAQIEPFNKKGVQLTEATTFQGDLEWDSLTVMDFVAAIEDEFDIIITMNMQAEIETVGQLVDAVAKLKR